MNTEQLDTLFNQCATLKKEMVTQEDLINKGLSDFLNDHRISVAKRYDYLKKISEQYTQHIFIEYLPEELQKAFEEIDKDLFDEFYIHDGDNYLTDIVKEFEKNDYNMISVKKLIVKNKVTLFHKLHDYIQ